VRPETDELVTETYAAEPRDTARYLAAVREHWVLVLVVLGIAIVAAAGLAVSRQDVYVAQADVLVSPVDTADQALTGLGLLRDPSGSVFTAGRLLESPQVQDRVLRRLSLHETRIQLKTHVHVIPLQQSNIVSIEASAGSRKPAAAIANAFADALITERTRVFQTRLKQELVRLKARRTTLGSHPATADAPVADELDQQIAYLTSFVGQNDPTLQVWSQAVPPDAPKPKSSVGVIAAFFAALLLGTGAAVLLELLSGKIRRDYELGGRAPILARVPRLRRNDARRYLAGDGSLPAGAWEAYRIVRARLAVGDDGTLPQSIAVTSAMKSEGKTMTSVNVARALAASGERVVLVDANLRDPGIATAFGLAPPDHGLLALLEGAAPEDVLVTAGTDRRPLSVVLPEANASQALELLDRRRVESLLSRLAPYGIVVIDLPAIMEYGEAVAVAGAADTVLLCVRLGRTDRDLLAETLDVVRRDGIDLGGVILTGRHRPGRRGAQPLFESVTEDVVSR
jgi:polysaccharide biosynthesis transport protein